MISFSSAWSTDAFNNSLTAENITFIGNENFTRWLSVPENRITTSGFMNLSGYEFINYTNYFDGSGFSEGTLAECLGIGCFNITKAIQGNFSIINLTVDKIGIQIWKTAVYTSGNVSIKIYSTTTNFILVDCNLGLAEDISTSNTNIYTCDFANTVINEDVYITVERDDISSGRINVMGDNTINLLGNSYIYNNNTGEWSIHSFTSEWTFNITFLESPLFPTSSLLLINDTQTWNYTEKLNSTNSPQKTLDLATTINNYISTATATAGYYLVPFIFHSDTAGILEYFNLIFNNEGFIENSQTFNNQTIEGATEMFTMNITYESIDFLSSLDVKLIYNETEYGISFIDTGNTLILSRDIIIPSVSADTNVSFHWELSATGWSQNSSTNNQTILNFEIDNCSVFTNKIMSLTQIDEELQTTISNGTIEIAVNILTEDRSSTILNLSNIYTNINPTEICLNINFTTGSNYLLDSIIRYESSGYANEYYNIVGLVLNNDTEIQNIGLFDLNSSDSTEFQLTFNGEDFLPVEDALIFVERQYISENTFKTVELPKTDSNGQTVLHLVRNDAIYNIIVMKDGEILGSFTNIIAFCQDFTIGECVITLNALSDISAIFNYDDEVGILYNSPPRYNSTTNKVTFSFTSTDGEVKNVFMNVEKRDIFGNNSICSNTVVSISGTLSCDIGTDLSDTILFTTITIDGQEWIADTTEIDKTNFGSIGFVMWFILSIALLLMFAESKNGVMLSVAISYIGAVTLGLATGTITGIGSAGVWILVITSIGIWKINKNRKS